MRTSITTWQRTYDGPALVKNFGCPDLILGFNIAAHKPEFRGALLGALLLSYYDDGSTNSDAGKAFPASVFLSFYELNEAVDTLKLAVDPVVAWDPRARNRCNLAASRLWPASIAGLDGSGGCAWPEFRTPPVQGEIDLIWPPQPNTFAGSPACDGDDRHSQCLDPPNGYLLGLMLGASKTEGKEISLVEARRVAAASYMEQWLQEATATLAWTGFYPGQRPLLS